MNDVQIMTNNIVSDYKMGLITLREAVDQLMLIGNGQKAIVELLTYAMNEGLKIKIICLI